MGINRITSCGDGNSWLVASLYSSHLLVTSFLSRALSCRSFAFTGTFSQQSSLSFTSSLSSTPGTIPLPPFSQPFVPFGSAVSAARRALSLSFLRRHRSSCSCADLRPLLELLWESMFKKVVSNLNDDELSGNLLRYSVRTSIRRARCFGLKESTCIYGTTYDIYICILYMKIPPLYSLVWGSLRLAPIS